MAYKIVVVNFVKNILILETILKINRLGPSIHKKKRKKRNKKKKKKKKKKEKQRNYKVHLVDNRCGSPFH